MFLVVLLLLFVPELASAHAFGQNFTLPLPASFYVTGGVTAFIASCLVIFAIQKPALSDIRRTERSYRLHPLVTAALRTTGLLLLALSISFGIWSSADYWINPLPNLFWVMFMLGFTYVSVLVGGLWDLLNPFKTISKLIVEDRTLDLQHSALHYLPTAALFGLLWLELFSGGLGAQPIVLTIIAVLYLLVCIAGSYTYGVDRWFREYDFFSVFFGLVGMLAPVTLRDGRIVVSPTLSHLTNERSPHWGELTFILMLLGSTVLDGLRETEIWREFLFLIQRFGIPLGDYLGVIFLALTPLLLLSAFALAVYLMRRITMATIPPRDLSLRFARSLIPIAVAYHFAHYIGLLLSEGQRFIAQMSDPYALGWDMFGTAGREINIYFIGADTVWYIQLSVIVIGHVVAALVAHRIALTIFPKGADAIKSQLPMLILMVGYTGFGLWTLSQPFVAG